MKEERSRRPRGLELGRRLGLWLALFVCAAAAGSAQELEAPELVLAGSSFEARVTGVDAADAGRYRLRAGETELPLTPADGALTAQVSPKASGSVALALLVDGTAVAETRTRVLSGWLSILPPLLAIVLALALRQVIPALFLGTWLGAALVAGVSPAGVFGGLLDSFQVHVLAAVTNPDHGAIILFSLMIGGMVGVMSKAGGTQGIVNRVVGFASSPRRGQLTTGFMGCAIFFDDYANSLVVGNTMRPVTDRLRISREKLAYIVDSTAAPVSCLALVTTWIGYEVGLIGTAVAKIENYDEAAYSIFLNSIPYSFYPMLAIAFVFLVAATGRDFGPMRRAERRARSTGAVIAAGASVDIATAEGTELAPEPGKPCRAVNAVLPVLVLVLGVLVGLYVTGVAALEADGESSRSLKDIVGAADSYRALMWASLLGVLTAIVLALVQRILTLKQTVDSWYGGVRAMLLAMIILVLAWSLADVTEALRTSEYLVSILGDAMPKGVLPSLVFVLSAAVAFSTGSSWSTMAILMPLVVPLSWAVVGGGGQADAEHLHVLYSTIACVLAGAVWGDHCSPISDTTVLSSMASGCDHVDHVRTQLPYAVTVGIVAIFLGSLPVGFGVPWWVALPVGVLVLWGLLRALGRDVDEEPAVS